MSGKGKASEASGSRDSGIGARGKQKKDAMLTAGVWNLPHNLMNCIKYGTHGKVEAGKLVCARAQKLGILGLR